MRVFLLTSVERFELFSELPAFTAVVVRTLERAQAGFEAIAASLSVEYPATNKDVGARLDPPAALRSE